MYGLTANGISNNSFRNRGRPHYSLINRVRNYLFYNGLTLFSFNLKHIIPQHSPF